MILSDHSKAERFSSEQSVPCTRYAFTALLEREGVISNRNEGKEPSTVSRSCGSGAASSVNASSERAVPRGPNDVQPGSRARLRQPQEHQHQSLGNQTQEGMSRSAMGDEATIADVLGGAESASVIGASCSGRAAEIATLPRPGKSSDAANGPPGVLTRQE